MKKIISIFVVLAMLCTMWAVPAMAEATVSKTYIDNTTGASISNQTAETEVTGIRGKTADDVSTYVTRIRPQSEIDSANTDNHKFQYLIHPGTTDAAYGDLLVFSMDFVANSNIRNVYLTGDGGVNISTMFSLDDERVIDGWNKLVYVYDHSTAGSAKGEKAGSWAMYLNGECINALGDNRVDISQTKTDSNGNTITYVGKGHMTQMRVMFNGKDATQEISMYFDNTKCYTVTTDDKAAFVAQFEAEKPVVAESTAGKYTVADGVITSVEGATAADIEVADDTTIRIFQNGRYTSQLTDTTLLKSGNIVVVEKNGIYNYYTVAASDGAKVLYEAYQASDITTFYRGDKSDVADVGGKLSGDSSILLDSNVIEHVDQGQTHYNGFFAYAPGSIANGVWSGIDTSGYLVVEGEVFPASIKTIGLATNGGTTYADIPASANEWNKFYVVYDFTNKKIKVVVDGVATTEWEDEPVYGTANKNDIRFIITGNDNEAPAQVYLDDYRVYTVKTEPDYDAPAALDTAKYTITDGYLVADADTTAGNITVDGATVRVYADSTYTNVLASSDILLKDNVVVVESSNGCFAYYPVQSALSRIPLTLVAEYSDSGNLTKPAVGRASLAVADGFGGKDASDKVGQVTETQQDNDFFFQTTVPTTTSVITATILVYPHEDVTGYSFNTNSHNVISDTISASELVDGKWNRITMIYNPATLRTQTYLNDEFYSEIDSKAMGSNLRFLFKTGGKRDADARAVTYYDDFMVYTGPVAVPAVDFGDYTVNAWGINGYGEDTVADALTQITPIEGYEDYTVKICDAEGNVASSDDAIEQGYTVSVYDGNIRLGTYLFDVPDYEVAGDAVLTVDGYDPANGKFGEGTLELRWDVNVYKGSKNIYGVIAQYDADKNLVNTVIEKNVITGKGSVKATLDVTECEGTIKCMLWDAGNLMPLAKTSTYTAYSDSKIEDAIPLYEGFTTKSAVFNYDDGIASDKQLVDLLDKYQAKATFNLVSGRLYGNMKSAAAAAGYGNSEADVYAYAKAMYAGAYGNHEIANHTVTHRPASLNPGETSKDSHGSTLVGVSTEEQIADIQNCPIQLRQWFGLSDDEAIGQAWPNGYAHKRSDYYTDLEPAMKEVGLKYARDAENGKFDLPEDWYRWNSTAHHPDAAPYVKQFIALPNAGDMKCLFIWGHTYEFNDAGDDDSLNWNYIEGIISDLADQGNIWFATNGDVYRYVEATKLVEVTDTAVTNNSAMTVYYNINGKNVELAPGATYTIGQ